MTDQIKKTYGIDLDATLAHYTLWVHHTEIGVPIPAMVSKVKDWIEDGHDVIIFTARMNAEDHLLEDIQKAIEDWCVVHIGQKLQITGKKLLTFDEYHDDKAVAIVPNTGLSHSEFMIKTFAVVHKDDPWLIDALSTLLEIQRNHLNG